MQPSWQTLTHIAAFLVQAALEAMLAARCQDNDGEQWQQLQVGLLTCRTLNVPASPPVQALLPCAAANVLHASVSTVITWSMHIIRCRPYNYRATPRCPPQPQLVPPSGPVVAPAPSAPSAAGGGGPLSGLIADDNAAVGGLAAALGSLERSLGALGAAVRASRMGGGPCSRPADWDQLQVGCTAACRLRPYT